MANIEITYGPEGELSRCASGYLYCDGRQVMRSGVPVLLKADIADAALKAWIIRDARLHGWSVV